MRVGHDGGDAEPPGQVRRGHRAPGPNLVELNIALPGEECGNIIVGVLLNHSGFLKLIWLQSVFTHKILVLLSLFFVKPFPFQCAVISQVAVKLHKILTKLIIPECNNLELVDNQYSNLPSK